MDIPKVKRETENGIEVAVLISPGYGAGWSSWSYDSKDILLFHKDLVELVLKGERGTAARLAEYGRVNSCLTKS